MSGGNQRLPFYMASNATINGGNYQVQCTTMNVYNATGNNVITTTGGGLDGTLHNLTNTQLITSDTPSFQVTVGTTYTMTLIGGGGGSSSESSASGGGNGAILTCKYAPSSNGTVAI